jgi:hypothetical protein
MIVDTKQGIRCVRKNCFFNFAKHRCNPRIPGRKSISQHFRLAAHAYPQPWYRHLARRAYMIMPKSLSARLEATKRNLFSERWLAAPDDLGVFPTNGDRFVAEELWRLKELKRPVYKGFLLQGLAASWHYMGGGRLKAIGNNVKQVLVCTGTDDQMIEYTHSDVLVAGISAGGADVKKRYFEGAGHALNWETLEDYNKMVEEFVTGAHQG